MNGEQKIRPAHRSRLAIIYLRQSTASQVRMNTESTARQYALTETAAALGWPATNTIVFDGDLGTSGRSTAGRADFVELVHRVCQGEVGLILVLEASRLSRSSADFARLWEFCQVTDTLVADADGVYDLRDFNDGLILGFKGQMSQVELHILAQRMQEAKRAAARRGELALPLPIGYVYDEAGEVIVDPDEEVRAAVADVFAAFTATGSSHGVVGAFAARRFPSHGLAWTGELRWGRLRHSQVTSMLHNPTYTGAYVSGRSRSERYVDPAGLIRTRQIKLPREQWTTVIEDHHPAYLDRDTFTANQARLAANLTRRGARPPRAGSALLQGIVRCGHCGQSMSVYYSSAAAHYRCMRSRLDQTVQPGCRSVTAASVDASVVRRLLEEVTPTALALAVAAADELTTRQHRATRAFDLRVERASYEASRAERAFHLCEPENRLVARSLETRWEGKLAALADAEAELAAASAAAPPAPPPAELVALAADLPALWAAPTTADKDRKRLLRTLIADVTISSDPVGDEITVGIRWQTGAAEQHSLTRTRIRTNPHAVDLVRTLTAASRRDSDIAAELNARGLTTARGHPFDTHAVRNLRHTLHISSADPRQPDELTVAELAARLGIGESTVYYWTRSGRLSARHTDKQHVFVAFPPDIEQACRDYLDTTPHIRRTR